uniref:Craniofacial development protein 2 n=1 Tax=Cacopsylla melanoneura TaxID=428564 RepID=A0A8D8V658_9HEMI
MNIKHAPATVQSLGTTRTVTQRNSALQQNCPGPSNGLRFRTRNNRHQEQTLKIGTLNIITMNNKIEECIDILIDRKLDILGLSEVKRKGCGCEELRSGFHIYWSGGDNAKNGVAIIVNKTIKDLVTEVTDRIIKMNIKLHDEIISILQCYAPQAGCPDSDKLDFETQLENHLRGDKNIIMGDMNAQVGTDRTNQETVMGPWGYGNQNPEGERLIDLCIRNEMLLGNTWFKKRDSHKITR